LVHIQIEEIISYNINMSKNKNSISNNKVVIDNYIYRISCFKLWKFYKVKY